METANIKYDKLYYCLYLFEVVLFKVPNFLGVWLFDHDCAIKQYIGVRQK